MSERDDDIIDFDFFDEPQTVEQQSTPRVRMPRRRGRDEGPPRPPVRHAPPGGFAPLLRLVGLIAFAILIVVLLVFWVQSCQGASKRNAYRSYVENVNAIANASQSVGRDLTDALTTPGEKMSDLQQTLTGLAQREQQDVAKAEGLKPPGPLRDEHAAAVQALQFRVSGLQGLAASFRALAGRKASDNDAATLAQQSQRFLASDVIWSDLFTARARDELDKQGITGVAPPDSQFLSEVDLVTPAAWTPVLQRLRGASTGGTPSGGLHGTALVAVKALPSGQVLSASQENTVIARSDLGFAVTVKDSGDAQEVGIQVTLTIEASPPIVKTQTIGVIDPGEEKTVVFRNLGRVPFAQKTNVKVDVAPVPQEQRTENNSAVYPVIFSLG
jgi:hypothetical protein